MVVLLGCDSSTPNPAADSGNSVGKATASTDSAGFAADVAPSKIRVEDVAAKSGIDFTARTGQESQHYTILESLGSGVAFCDYDGDSQLDIAAPGGGIFDKAGFPQGQPFGLFRQTIGSRFQTVAALAALPDVSFYSHGIAVADWDNDGFCDFLITGFHGRLMLHNDGDGTFSRELWGLPAESNVWSTSAAFLDLENDGDLDCYIVNYVNLQPGEIRECIVKGHRDVCPPGEYDAVSDQLMINNGDGTFEDSSASVGLIEGGKGLAVISGDLDHDGDCDVYVANDTTPNLLYINDGAGHLVEQGLISGSALGVSAEAEGSMGVEFADFNRDGRTDIWVSNYENQSFAMYESRGTNIFQHVSRVRGITSVGQLFVGFGTLAFDADLDGDQDIFCTNGHVMYHAAGSPRKQTPLIFENLNGQLFRNVAPQGGLYSSSPHEGRGLATGDFDQDGRIDVVISHTNEKLSLLRNISLVDRRAMSVRLVGRSSNRDGIGAVAEFSSSQNEYDMILLNCGGGSYLSSRSNIHTVPFKSNSSKDDSEEAERLEVLWPGGRKTQHKINIHEPEMIVEPLDTSQFVK